MLTLNELKETIYELGNSIGLNKDSILYPLFATSPNVLSEGISVYIDDSEYHYIAMERGQVIKHFKSLNLEEILYYVFESITFTMATEFELNNRNEGEDFRRLLFSKQLELMKQVGEFYYKKCKMEIDNILKIAPFRD